MFDRPTQKNKDKLVISKDDSPQQIVHQDYSKSYSAEPTDMTESSNFKMNR